MDIQGFKDLDLNKKDGVPENLPKADLVSDVIPEPVAEEPVDEGDKIIKDLENRLAQIKSTDSQILAEDDENEEVAPPTTFLEKIQPFILPICLTIFAIIFAGLFLYFFSKSKIDDSVHAIVNTGATEVVTYDPPPVIKQQPVVIPEKLTCTDPQVLNDTGDACVDPAPVVVATTTPEKTGFANGETYEVNVRFSFDKFNYDNYPRGIYLNAEQDFDGDYADFKINPTNRATANDKFFGVDRYMVSLIGACSFVIDDARISVSGMRKGNNNFTGTVIKILDASKPHVVCGK